MFEQFNLLSSHDNQSFPQYLYGWWTTIQKHVCKMYAKLSVLGQWLMLIT